ncbi:MAG: prepilin-type N-terminal cleavage/methylation domain-containing protein [Planctomycetes bacterium]|nr:prepilin-type N-terminal cleavage/methylation domain-containing protein [Planctomycetota bacterium]
MTGTSNTLATYGQALELKMTKSLLTSDAPTGPSARGKAVSHRYRPGAVGFTLLELMVAVSIMAIIMLAFGGLLTQANLVVTEGEKRMRADAAASAISRIVRGDIRKITKNGFLRVSSNKLVLVTAGRMQSSFGNYSGDGAIIVYGRHDASKVLYRKILILSKDAPDGIVDCLRWNNAGMSLAELQVMDIDEMTALANYVAQDPPSMAYPPQTLSQVSTMWIVLAGDCTELNISQRQPDNDSWNSNTTCTRYSQANWPDAIKFKFKLEPHTLMSAAIADNELSNDQVTYEILCPVGH